VIKALQAFCRERDQMENAFIVGYGALGGGGKDVVTDCSWSRYVNIAVNEPIGIGRMENNVTQF